MVEPVIGNPIVFSDAYSNISITRPQMYVLKCILWGHKMNEEGHMLLSMSEQN